jgi:subtilisin family serine protease
MKRQIFACLALAAVLLPSSAGAQEPRIAISPWLLPLAERPTTTIPEILRTPLGGNQGRHRLDGREALSLHLRTTASREELAALGAHVRTLLNGRATVNLLPEDLPALAADPRISSIALPRPLELSLNKSVADTGIPPLRTLSNGSFTGATGAGVVVGMFDSGIDLDHPNFKDAQGKTRIAFLLDQTTGIECTANDIDAGQCTQQDDPASAGHGTHTTGTAAGNGAAPDGNGVSWTHVGVAPESTIVFVKADLSSFELIDALEYIFARADQLGMPAVINLSVNWNLGAHDGTDSMEEMIDDLVAAKPGRAVVISAGNSRGDAIHAESKAKPALTVAGPSFLVPSYTPGSLAGNDVVQITGYYASTDDLTVHLLSPSGLSYSRQLTNLSCSAEIPGADGNVRICNTKGSNFDQSTTAREIVIIIRDKTAGAPPAEGLWSISLTGNTVAGTGEVDFWMFSHLGQKDIKARFASHVDPYETVSLPGTGRNSITVGAHVTRYCWEDFTGAPWDYASFPGNPTLGDIAPFSNFGPTRDGRMKPEISAPGMGIVAPLADEVKEPLIAADAGTLIVNDYYLILQGTSMAAPHVTGAVALLLQQNPTADTKTLRSILTASARDDVYTRKYESFFLNFAFGAGKLDLGRWGMKDPYETNNHASQAWEAFSGQVLKGFIELPADVDYFLLHGMQAGDTVNVTLDSLPHDYALALQARTLPFDDCGWGGTSTKGSSNQPGTENESITYTASGIQPTLDGVASYLRVASSAGATSSTDSYELKAILTRPETTGIHNSIATAQKLPSFNEMKVAGTVSGSAGDYYSFRIMPGKTIELSAPDQKISLLEQNGTILDKGTGSLSYEVPFGGLTLLEKTLYVVIAGGSLGSYTLNLKIQ